MPVAQLVHHFESMDYTPHEVGIAQVAHVLNNTDSSRRQRLSLKTLFRSHARITSASSTAARTESSPRSAASPTFSISSFECLSASITIPSPSSDSQGLVSTHLPTSTPSTYRPVRPMKVQRTFSSTSLALQSEYRLDQIHNPGLHLFEPRPHNCFSGNPVIAEPVIMDGIIQVMRGG